MKRKVERFIALQVVEYIARIFYITGLTVLIPLFPLFLSPQQLVSVKYALIFSVSLIIISFMTIYFACHSKKLALRALGLMTLIPGLLAVVFSSLNPNTISAFLALFGPATPYLNSFVDSYIPKAWLLASIYILIGTGLIYLSEKVRR